MRLIDADGITGVSTHQTGNSDYDRGYAEGAVRVLRAIEHAPTMEAIPISWIKRVEAMGFDYMHCAGVILGMWKREQEGR